MNNIFYEFLEKNQLQGLEENLSILDVFNEEKGAGALLQILPKNDNYEIISAEYMSCMITHNKKRYTLYMRNSGRTFFIMPRGVVTIDAAQQKTIDEILNLLRTKAGISGFKPLSSRSIKVGDKTLTSPIYTFLRGDITKFYKILRNFIINKRPGVSTDTLTRGSKPGSVNTGEKGNSDPSNDNINNKSDETKLNNSSKSNSTTTDSNNSQSNNAAQNEAYQKAIKDNTIIEFIENIKKASVFMKGKYLKPENGFFAKTISAKQTMNFGNKGSESEIEKAVSSIKIKQSMIRKSLSNAGYKGEKIINQFLTDHKKIVTADEPAIKWFYENHVNNHFTMKRIFNS